MIKLNLGQSVQDSVILGFHKIWLEVLGVVKDWVGRVFLFLRIFSNRISLVSIILKGSLWNWIMNSKLFSKSVCYCRCDLKNELTILDLKILMEFESSRIWIHRSISSKASSSFSSQLVLLMAVREKEYMKLDVGKVVDHMTQGSYIPTDSVKSGDDCSSLVHSIGTGYIFIRIRPIWNIRLVKVMICLVGNIRIRDQGIIWITIKIEKIVVISHITPRLFFRILPTRHIITLTNLMCWIILIRINICPSPNTMNKIGTIIIILHRVSGDITPLSHIVNHLTYI